MQMVLQAGECVSEENMLIICVNKHHIWSGCRAVQWCF